MLKNYLKIATRHLWRHKRYVFINLTGLGIALAACILAYLSWKFDHDFDRFHAQGKQIYRVVTTKQSNHLRYGVSPIPLAEAAEEKIAGVQAGLTVDSRTMVVTDGKETHWERVTFVEPDFFDWFNFPLAAGGSDLTDPNSLLLTEELAVKYFGTADPIGQTLTLNPDQPYRKDLVVTGILQNTPMNSSIQFDLLTHAANQFNRDGEKVNTQDWSYFVHATFLVLKSPEDRAFVADFLQEYLPAQNSAHPDWKAETFSLEPLLGMAHHARDLRWNAMYPSLPSSMIWGTISMALLMLLTACLNFTNMTVSLAGKRLKEIGVRKVMGGTRLQLVVQLLVEGLMMSLVGLGLGLLLIDWVLPHYNQMWQFLDLKLSFADNLPLWAFLLGTVLMTTLLAAAYPAFYISAFSPTRIFRGNAEFAGSSLFSRTLLGAQVTISTLAVVAGIAFAQNATFQQEADLGFEREGVQAIFTPDEKTYRVMEQRAQQMPGVAAVSGVQAHIGDSAPRIEFKLRENIQEAELMRVGENYLETMQIRLLAGRSFNYELASDYEQTILVNEQFVDQYFPDEDPLGQQVAISDTVRYTIAGVVGNFIQDNFFDPIRPLMMTLVKTDQFRYLVVKSSSENMLAIRDNLERNWKSTFPEHPFEHHFQNDFLAGSLEVTTNIKQLFVIFSLVTLFLTIAGLASLLSLDVLKRLKEITIRRILGAGSGQIAYLLTRNFFLVIVLGLFLGGLSGLWMAKMLLDNIYEVHVGVQAYPIFVAAFAVLILVIVTIASRIFKVLTGNPARSLRSE